MILDENCGAFCPIPDDAIDLILSYCKASALVRMGTTCRRLFYLADRTPMWRELCHVAKLSVKEGASYRRAFLSAIARQTPDAYTSQACFFSNNKYTQVDKVRALACCDYAINMQPFSMNDCAFSERQIEAVFQKGELFFNPFDFKKSTLAPGQIDALYDQLGRMIETCSSKDKVAKARLLYMVIQINDLGLALLPYSYFWHACDGIRKDQQVSDEVRNAAEYLLAFLPKWKPDGRWEPTTLAQFRQNQGELSLAERGKIFKKCLNDQAATPWMHPMATIYLALMRVFKETEEITDEEACEMLESLKNSPSLLLIPPYYLGVLENLSNTLKTTSRSELQ